MIDLANEGRIVAGWIAPHGVVPDMPEERLRLVPGTDAAMRSAAERIVSLEPEAIVIVTPHGFRGSDANTVSLCVRNAIELSTWYPWTNGELTAKGDTELAVAILSAAQERAHPAIGLIYGATSEPVYPIDWSITAPLRYLQEAGYSGSLVPVTFSELPFQSDWNFGRTIAAGIAASGRRVAIVASSDLSHLHSAEGPYGYNAIAPEFDAHIESAIRSGNLASLLELDPAWVKQAAQDGLRSILILAGALEDGGFTAEVLAYEVLIYFGMLTAILTERA